jgi:hypothetical protein
MIAVLALLFVIVFAGLLVSLLVLQQIGKFVAGRS